MLICWHIFNSENLQQSVVLACTGILCMHYHYSCLLIEPDRFTNRQPTFVPHIRNSWWLGEQDAIVIVRLVYSATAPHGVSTNSQSVCRGWDFPTTFIAYNLDRLWPTSSVAGDDRSRVKRTLGYRRVIL